MLIIAQNFINLGVKNTITSFNPHVYYLINV